MDLQREMNVDLVMEHEKLCHNVNAFWGPEQAPFTYMTSKWGEASSWEISLDSDDDLSDPTHHQGFVSMGSSHPHQKLSGWDNTFPPKGKSYTITTLEPATCAPLHWSHYRVPSSSSEGAEGSGAGEQDQLLREQGDSWVYRLFK